MEVGWVVGVGVRLMFAWVNVLRWTGWVTAGVFNPKNLSLFKYNYQFLCSLQPLIHSDVGSVTEVNTHSGELRNVTAVHNVMYARSMHNVYMT